MTRSCHCKQREAISLGWLGATGTGLLRVARNDNLFQTGVPSKFS